MLRRSSFYLLSRGGGVVSSFVNPWLLRRVLSDMVIWLDPGVVKATTIVGEIFPMAMLSSWWQFPLPGLPTTLDVATRVGHGLRQMFRARGRMRSG